ncbi:MAG: serine acetyltransferase [Bacteroidales bacterium]|nr:serine acetyltransferase [Bacteroidales bacterium]
MQNAIDQLSRPESARMVYMPQHGRSMPSVKVLSELVEKLREVIFPGYFGNASLHPENLKYHIGVNVDRIYRLLADQVLKGICFTCKAENSYRCEDCEDEALDKAAMLIERLPEIRRLLATDVKAAYLGDPAAKSQGEIIFSYPSIRAMTNHRVAHELYKINVPLIPRIISEMAHSETGIDIHPAAEIGEHFAIDHGTGVVIGETSKIGNNVKVYQGVTLGARSFPLDENGNPIKGIPRHPVVEDDVVIYANATILGRITVGKGSMIGGNIWVTKNVPPKSKIIQQRPLDQRYVDGAGI